MVAARSPPIAIIQDRSYLPLHYSLSKDLFQSVHRFVPARHGIIRILILRNSDVVHREPGLAVNLVKGNRYL